MGILGNLFGSKQDPLQEQADMLVPAARANATGMFAPLLDKFPFLQDADVNHWDFIVTVAGVFMGATRLTNLKIGNSREEKLMETVAEQLVDWNANGIQGFEDCKGFFENEYDALVAAGHDPTFIASDAVGKWIVWNTLDRAPESQSECELVRSAGTLVTHAFFNWWQDR